MFCTLLRIWNRFHKANLFWKYYGLRAETITGADDDVESPLRGINYCYSTFRLSTWATYVAVWIRAFSAKSTKGGKNMFEVLGCFLAYSESLNFSGVQDCIQLCTGGSQVQLFRIKSSQWNKQTMPSNSKLALPFIRVILVDLLLFIANI